MVIPAALKSIFIVCLGHSILSQSYCRVRSELFLAFSSSLKVEARQYFSAKRLPHYTASPHRTHILLGKLLCSAMEWNAPHTTPRYTLHYIYTALYYSTLHTTALLYTCTALLYTVLHYSTPALNYSTPILNCSTPVLNCSTQWHTYRLFRIMTSHHTISYHVL